MGGKQELRVKLLVYTSVEMEQWIAQVAALVACSNVCIAFIRLPTKRAHP